MSRKRRKNIQTNISNNNNEISNQSSSESEISLWKKMNTIMSDPSSSDCDSSDTEFNEDENNEELLEELIYKEEEINNDAQYELSNIKWKQLKGKENSFPFTGLSGLLKELPNNISPEQVYSLFITDEIINLLVTETNRYAAQKIEKSNFTPMSRITGWKPTNCEEMKKFLGLIIWMRLVEVPSLAMYWSTDILYNFQLPRTIMPRNRFQLLLSHLHFANNENIEKNDRLGKILSLFDLLVEKYQEVLSPGKDFVIDETMIPWQGKLIIKQYIPDKACEYGIKLFKLCSMEDYTWSMKMYSGKLASDVGETGLAQNACYELAHKLLDEGRTMYIENFYTNYKMALELLQRRTHIVGTLRPNRKFLPEDILSPNLKKGEVVSRKDDNGVIVFKWKNVHDITMLSTKHVPDILPSQGRAQDNASSLNCQLLKKLRLPTILDYKKGKYDTDRSNQLAPYATTVFKNLKWYRKLGLHLILEISLVNAFVVYKLATKQRIKMTAFRELLIVKLLQLSPNIIRSMNIHQPSETHNVMVRRDLQGKTIRRMCVFCYEKSRRTLNRLEARRSAKKTMTYCPTCLIKPQLCLDCFPEYHANQRN